MVRLGLIWWWLLLMLLLWVGGLFLLRSVPMSAANAASVASAASERSEGVRVVRLARPHVRVVLVGLDLVGAELGFLPVWFVRTLYWAPAWPARM